MMETHFSFGSFLDFHGCSTSPLRTRLEWKYLCGSARMAEEEEEPKDEPGLEVKGVPNGLELTLGTGVMTSLS